MAESILHTPQELNSGPDMVEWDKSGRERENAGRQSGQYERKDGDGKL